MATDDARHRRAVSDVQKYRKEALRLIQGFGEHAGAAVPQNKQQQKYR
jgi:hypothetical protein